MGKRLPAYVTICSVNLTHLVILCLKNNYSLGASYFLLYSNNIIKDTHEIIGIYFCTSKEIQCTVNIQLLIFFMGFDHSILVGVVPYNTAPFDLGLKMMT